MKLTQDYYLQDDVLKIARDLLGKVLFTRINGEVSAGIITETEAYAGINDKASHAYGGKRTKRTETMYAQGGTAYVYLCYGMYHLFNVITNSKDIPDAVLIRAIIPYDNEALILQRRGKDKWSGNLLNGPGKLSIGLGINRHFNAKSLFGDEIWIEDRGIHIDEAAIQTTPRIGVAYAAEDALLPYRFILTGKSRFLKEEDK